MPRVAAVIADSSTDPPRLCLHGADSAPPLSGVRVALVGLIRSKTEWIEHRFDFFALSLIVRGSGTFAVDDAPPVAVNAGSFFAEYPGPLFRYGPTTESWDEYSLVLAGPALSAWRERGLVPCDGAVHTVASVAPHIERFRVVRRLFRRRGPGDDERAAIEAERLLVELCLARDGQLSGEPGSRRLDEVLEYCSAHCAEDIDFPKLARRFGMSYSSLRQQVRRATGRAPAAHVLWLRCEAAKRLLGETDLSIKEISARLGWRDLYTMSRAFKRCVGLSPRAYRHKRVPWGS